MKTKCYCGKEIFNGHNLCMLCKQKLDDFCKSVNLNAGLLVFAIENLEWLAIMEQKCKSDWHGTLSLTIKKGEPKIARWLSSQLLGSEKEKIVDNLIG